MTAANSPKAKIKKYFHLRDDIYEYISQHWDIICRRERIKNWRHTIGMTLSHYQKLFQNGYHIFQNTGYWSLKDNVPSPYIIDPVGSTDGRSDKRKREKESNSYDYAGKANPIDSPNKDEPLAIKKIALDRSASPTSGSLQTPSSPSNTNTLPIPSLFSSPNSFGDGLPHIGATDLHQEDNEQRPRPTRNAALRMTTVRSDIDRFKREMLELQQEIDGLQEQVRVKNAEEQLLKFLQEGITAFRDRIKQRIELLRAEMLNNHAEHQQQINNMSSELTQLREMGSDLRSTFQLQFARLVNLEGSCISPI